ncbi:hypothetical protein H4R34_003906 [Dimargaris verticillata]|uniref:UFSP1/2/DUB catalytic domain-containing protein n=1 Tax=Dimargaris verticillata TaxID=2761393 RepID=A0A9W8E7R7_9FUNG|nr:hypothetical protein H4R34_003906 [Dimargaris verticillata]
MRCQLLWSAAVLLGMSGARVSRAGQPPATTSNAVNPDEPRIATIRLSQGQEYYNKGFKDARWGCGYRNTQILCSALLKRYPQLKEQLRDGVPGLKELGPQLKPDYSPTGICKRLNFVCNRHKWIGPLNVYPFLEKLGFQPLIIEFFPTENTKSPFEGLLRVVQLYFCNQLPPLPEHGEDITKVLETRRDYSVNQETCAPSTTPHLPLYLQNPVHSYTIVGFEQTDAGDVNLIVFSPQPHPATSDFKVGHETLKLPLERLSAKKLGRQSGYQILMIKGPKAPAQPCSNPDDQTVNNRYAFCRLPVPGSVQQTQP